MPKPSLKRARSGMRPPRGRVARTFGVAGTPGSAHYSQFRLVRLIRLGFRMLGTSALWEPRRVAPAWPVNGPGFTQITTADESPSLAQDEDV